LVRCFGTNGEKNQTSGGLYTARNRGSRRATNVIAVAAAAAGGIGPIIIIIIVPFARGGGHYRLAIARPIAYASSSAAVPQYRDGDSCSLVFLRTARRQGRPPDSAYALPPSRNPIRRCF